VTRTHPRARNGVDSRAPGAPEMDRVSGRLPGAERGTNLAPVGPLRTRERDVGLPQRVIRRTDGERSLFDIHWMPFDTSEIERAGGSRNQSAARGLDV